MRLSHIRRATGFAALVAATALATVGLAAVRTPLDQPSRHGARAAGVERLAEHYRGRYQLKLDEAGHLLAGAPAVARGVGA
jgi:hypothetical protein